MKIDIKKKQNLLKMEFKKIRIFNKNGNFLKN